MQEAADCQAVQDAEGRLMQGAVEHLTVLLVKGYNGHWTEVAGQVCAAGKDLQRGCSVAGCSAAVNEMEEGALAAVLAHCLDLYVAWAASCRQHTLVEFVVHKRLARLIRVLS